MAGRQFRVCELAAGLFELSGAEEHIVRDVLQLMALYQGVDLPPYLAAVGAVDHAKQIVGPVR
jgi:hypothetical protein